jgi:hypothetical protein
MHDVRLGVPLSPLKTRIFDLVRGAGELGIASEEISQIIYDGQATRACVRNHIHQINDALAGTDFEIRGDGALRGRFRLLKRKDAA